MYYRVWSQVLCHRRLVHSVTVSNMSVSGETRKKRTKTKDKETRKGRRNIRAHVDMLTTGRKAEEEPTLAMQHMNRLRGGNLKET